MGHITIEYMIMTPVLILQIFLFPLTASILIDNYAESRQAQELEQIAGHLGSTIQQLYYAVYHASMTDGSMRVNLDIPEAVDQYPYIVTLSDSTNQEMSYKIMKITLNYTRSNILRSTLVTLGDNVSWQNNVSFNSITHDLSLTANKTLSGIEFTVGGS